MKKKGHRPVTRVKNAEPNLESPDWVIWAAWADRITFEEIEKIMVPMVEEGKLDKDVFSLIQKKESEYYALSLAQ